jgi:hypothetical protein
MQLRLFGINLAAFREKILICLAKLALLALCQQRILIADFFSATPPEAGLHYTSRMADSSISKLAMHVQALENLVRLMTPV